ncbi:Peptidase M20 protein [Dioscorea alata]|uniref:Peptidase M20 protein n=1 Tax=Dioscorea alata TaxID=55571 RepID=A0ACB7VSH2_DIOAL|nr:Peptidase M20 protein [Dioscorea alata]
MQRLVQIASGGLFKGKTLIYSDLKHALLRILPKYLPEAKDIAILISSHIDTVFSAEGAGDCTSCVSVMLELARATAQWAHGFKNSVIFLFNTGEEEGLNGAHSFISQHPWSRTIRFMVDLEAMGIGGKLSIFQSGPSPWAMETFAKVAKYPSGQVVAEDLFHSGAIKSATDFQVYQEVAGLSGLDFAYTDSTAVYHTKNDKLKLLKPGSLQHLGENMLPFLLQSAMSPNLAKEVSHEPGATSEDRTIYFDVLALLIWTTSLLMGGSSGAISLGLACLSVVLMWIFSRSLSALVAFILPHISSSPMPYISNPWLIVGLFGAPASFGAFSG